MNGLKGFWPASRSAPSAMLTAWSPIRSRSLLILRHRDQETQVHRHRLLQGEERDRRLLDLDLHAVDLLVVGDDRPGLLGVHLGQGLDRAVDLALDLAAHQDQLAAQVLELLRKMLLHASSLVPSPQLQSASADRISRSFWRTVLASRRHGAQGHAPVVDRLEQVRLLAGRVELGLAVHARRRLELDLAGPARGRTRPSRSGGGCGRGRRRCGGSPRASRRPPAGTGSAGASSRARPSALRPCGSGRARRAPRSRRPRSPSGRRA